VMTRNFSLLYKYSRDAGQSTLYEPDNSIIALEKTPAEFNHFNYYFKGSSCSFLILYVFFSSFSVLSTETFVSSR